MKRTILILASILLSSCAGIKKETVESRGEIKEVIYGAGLPFEIKSQVIECKFDTRNEPDWSETGICWRFQYILVDSTGILDYITFMNIAKFITTVLATAQFTSAWWFLSVHNFNVPANGFNLLYGMISGITIIFGSFGILLGLITFLVDNWKK